MQARLGSERVPFKNLRLLGDISIAERGMRLLRSVDGIDEIYINTESEIIAEVCRDYGATWYRRDAALASSDARTDAWVLDFVNHVPCDVLVVINPCVVFLKAATVARALSFVADGQCDTVISAAPVRTHVLYAGNATNFDPHARLPRTQDLPVLHALNFGVGVWRVQTFREAMLSCGAGVLAGRIGVVETDGMESIDVDTEEDLRLAQACAAMNWTTPPRYDHRFDADRYGRSLAPERTSD